MINVKALLSALAVTVLLILASGFGNRSDSAAAAGNKVGAHAPRVPQVSVSFAHEPYFDHTQASIALAKGFFKQVGISITPNNKGLVAASEQTIPFLSSGRTDIISGSAQLFMPAAKKLPPFKIFAFADLFQGYALMAQPNKGYKSFDELRKSGMSSDAAFKKAIGQMKGKTFAFPSEAAIKGFITLMLQRGGLTLSDVKAVVAPDAQTTALMLSGRADFEVGGVPSHLTLQSKGYKPIVSSGDLAAAAKPSANSTALRAVFQDGWLAQDKWLNANHDTALRMLSVDFRINQFIHDHPIQALAIHTPFLNSAAGTKFNNKIGLVVYKSLDPFYTFSQQRSWFLNNKDPLNEKYVIGAYIKLYEEQHIFSPGEYKYTDFSVAGKYYREMLSLKKQADSAMRRAGSKTSNSAKSLLSQAKKYYLYFDFLDAARFAQAAARAAS
jgi:ABC-type nitrate/sulfonate/bicarbonate transport system substrate-binding protein